MGFDPSSIKKPRLLPENLPENASREDKITALANQLHDRGLTASVADAKRLAEGMVDTESKVLKDTSSDDTDVNEMRKTLQSGSQLFDSVLSDEDRFRQALPEEFRRFIDKSTSRSYKSEAPLTAAETPPAPQIPRATAQNQVFFSDAPSSTQVRGYKKEEFLNIPAPPTSSGESETVVEQSEDAVVASHTESTPESYTMMDVGIFKEDEPLEEATEPSEPDVETAPEEPDEESVQEIDPTAEEEDSSETEATVQETPEPLAEELEVETAPEQPVTEPEESAEPQEETREAEEGAPESAPEDAEPERTPAEAQPEIDLTNVFYTGSGSPAPPPPDPVPTEPDSQPEAEEVAEPEEPAKGPEEPEKKEDLAKEHGIDLYDIFKKKD